MAIIFKNEKEVEKKINNDLSRLKHTFYEGVQLKKILKIFYYSKYSEKKILNYNESPKIQYKDNKRFIKIMKINTVYVENDIKNNTNTLNILQRIEFNEIIYCNKHTEVFNPKNQNFRIQKLQPSLILAKKHKNFILKVPKNFSIGFRKNYYFSHMLNCLYDCSYCFLQGMFYSANYLIYVNYEDFFFMKLKNILVKILIPVFFLDMIVIVWF